MSQMMLINDHYIRDAIVITKQQEVLAASSCEFAICAMERHYHHPHSMVSCPTVWVPRIPFIDTGIIGSLKEI